MTAVPRPGAIMTPVTAAYWDAAVDGRLLLQRCGSCGHVQHYPRTLCGACWSPDVTWVDAAGTGAVATFTVVHVPGHPAWAGEVPYVLALVELDEGPRLLTNVVGIPPSAVVVGQRVRLARPAATPPGDGPALLQFAPDDAAPDTKEPRE